MANFKKFIALFLVLILLPISGFLVFEGQVVSADTIAYGTTTVTLTVTGGITMDCSSTAALGSISGITGGTATVDAICHVVDSNLTGYKIEVESATDTINMLKNDANQATTFPDYPNATPDYDFTVTDAQAGLGFTVDTQTDADADSAFLNDGASTCGPGGTISDGTHCWRSMSTLGTKIQIVNRTSATDAAGQDATLKLQAKIGTAYTQASGAYTGAIIVTATENP